MNQAANGQQVEERAIAQRESVGMYSTERNNEVASSAIASAAKAKTEAGFILAVKYPRDEETARIKILNICKNPEFADKAIYSKPIGTSTVEGPSIRFVETALRLWKHTASIQIPVLDDSEKIVFNQEVYDLEANVSFSEAITIMKTVERKSAEGRTVLGQRRNTNGQIVYIVQATEDEVAVKKSAAASKSIRNSGLRIIPEHIISEAMRACEGAIKANVNKDPEAAKRQIFDAFATLQIMPSDLEKFLQHPLTQVTPDEVANLRKVYQSINDGHSKWADYVAQKAPETAQTATVTVGKQKPTQTANKEQGTPKAAEPDASQKTEAIDGTFEKTKAAIIARLGKTAGNEFIMGAIGGFGYEKYEEIPTAAKRGEFLTQLLNAFEQLVPKK